MRLKLAPMGLDPRVLKGRRLSTNHVTYPVIAPVRTRSVLSARVDCVRTACQKRAFAHPITLERLLRARYACPARTRRPGMAPVCSPRSKVGVPATSVAS
jgi:hypothetical protein